MKATFINCLKLCFHCLCHSHKVCSYESPSDKIKAIGCYDCKFGEDENIVFAKNGLRYMEKG